jgi:Holliday junction resolvase
VVNPSKARGTAWERRLADYLRDHGFPYADRLPLRGSKDVGDIGGVPGFVIECKSHKQIDLATWVDEAVVEKLNARSRFAAVIFPRRSCKTERAYVVMELRDFVDLIK